MGVYVTTTSITPRMVGTKFDTATTALLSETLLDAEAEVNKYLSKRYDIATLIADPPPIVEAWVKNLTVGYMYQHMSRGGKDGMSRGKMYINQVLENLKRVAEYKSDLTTEAGAILSDLSNTGYAIRSTTTDYVPTANEDDQINWDVDQNKLDDIASDRDGA